MSTAPRKQVYGIVRDRLQRRRLILFMPFVLLPRSSSQISSNVALQKYAECQVLAPFTYLPRRVFLALGCHLTATATVLLHV